MNPELVQPERVYHPPHTALPIDEHDIEPDPGLPPIRVVTHHYFRRLHQPHPLLCS